MSIAASNSNAALLSPAARWMVVVASVVSGVKLPVRLLRRTWHSSSVSFVACTLKVTVGTFPARSGSIMAADSSRAFVEPFAMSSLSSYELETLISAWRTRPVSSHSEWPGIYCPNPSKRCCRSVTISSALSSRGDNCSSLQMAAAAPTACPPCAQVIMTRVEPCAI